MTLNYAPGARALICSNAAGIYPCWHSRFMMLLAIKEIGCFQAVASAHRDANHLHGVLEYYGHEVIRGSSRRNALSAMRAILALDKSTMRLVLTPDGPLGPRFQIKGGVLKLAQRYDLPIVPMTYSATHAIILGTWDRFIIPLPFISRIVVDFGAPIKAAALVNEDQLQDIMLQQTQKVDALCGLLHKIDYI
jgi:lysophospholipid acyltransferase (LPLAT)-like uncharacterized protein